MLTAPFLRAAVDADVSGITFNSEACMLSECGAVELVPNVHGCKRHCAGRCPAR